MTIRRIGLPGSAARTIPINPPSDVPIQSTSVASSAAINTVMSLQYCGNDIVAAVLQPFALSPARQIRTNGSTPRSCESRREMIEIPAVSGEPVNAEHRPRGRWWSPVRERNTVKAAPGQPAHRSGPIRSHLAIFKATCGDRRSRPQYGRTELHRTIRLQTGERRPMSRRYAEQRRGAIKRRQA